MLRTGFIVVSFCALSLRARDKKHKEHPATEPPSVHAALPNQPSPPDDPDLFMSIAFIGAPNSGKSETSNRMTGNAKFSVVSHATEQEEAAHRHAVASGVLTTKAGTSYLILDTPAFKGKADNQDLLVQMAHKSERGVNMFVFVLPYAWIAEASLADSSKHHHQETDKHMHAFKAFKDTFGKIALQHTALVFTKCGDKREDHIQEEIKDTCKEKPQEKICAMMLELGLPPLVAIGEMSAKRKARDQERMIQAAKVIMQKNHWHPYDAPAFAESRKERDQLQARIDKLMDGKGKEELKVMLRQVRKGIRDEIEVKRIMDMIEKRLKEAEEKARAIKRWRPFRIAFYILLVSLAVALSIPSSRKCLQKGWADFISDDPVDESGRKKEWNHKVLLAKLKAALVTLKDPAATKAATIGIAISLRTRTVLLLRKTAEAAEDCSCSKEEEAEQGEVQADSECTGDSEPPPSPTSSLHESLSAEIATFVKRLRKRLVEVMKSITGKGPTRGKGKKNKAKKIGKSVLPELK